MSDKDKKKKKPKGPIRTGAVVPLVLVMGAVVAFNIFLLDSTIKKTIEFGGGLANGAEVNVAGVTSSFKDLSIEVSGIQFTDPKNPDFNTFQVGALRFKMLWDALLRGKIVIDLAQIADVKLNTKRAKRGYVPPPPPKKPNKVLEQAKKEFDGNVFGDIANVAGGKSVGDTSEAIKDELSSERKLKEIEQKIKAQQAKLEKSFKDLPTGKELKKLEKRLSKIRWKDLGNITKAPGVLKEADKLKKDIDKTIKKYKKAEKEVRKSNKLLNDAYKEAEASVEEDIASVGKRMKIPSLDPKSIARMLFGAEMLQKVETYKAKYDQLYAKVEKYLPPKKDKAQSDKEKLKRPRGEGKNYSFGTPNSYPLFWMKLAKINSENDQGTVQGKIENITNDQKHIGKLTTANVKADFPALEMRDLKGDMVIDFTDKAPVATIEGSIASFPVADKALSKSKDVTFVIKKASAGSTLKAKLTPKKADIRVKNNFTKIDFETKAKSKVVDEVLANVAKTTPRLTLDAKATGKWDALGFDIKSNLAQAIQDSVQGLVQAKIKAMKDKIRKDIEAKIAGQKQQIQSQIDGMKKQYEGKLAEANKELDKVKRKLKGEEKKAKKKAKKAQKDLKKNLLKGIKL